MDDRTPSNARHTPGPWKWDGYSLRPEHPDPDRSAVHTILDAEHLGCGYCVSDPRRTDAESAANLRLIELAPDLYAALKQALPLLEAHHRACAEGAATINLARTLLLATSDEL